ncbi:MAG: TetR/AcrR family transcriptional regulator [Candidatus Aminicenantes bacterium]|nr:TetR/AcrR family transcriptional regulator [Candidatus Aminicenantes bacterium]
MKKNDLRAAREVQRRRENRETILHAAQAVIRRKGLSAASMDEVAAEAQFSKATLYRYFRSKSELVFEILTHFLEDLDIRLRNVRNQTDGARERLRDWISCSLRVLSENESLTRVFLLDRSFLRLLQIFVGKQTGAGTDAEKRFLHKLITKRKAMLEGSRSLLREGVASGEFRPMDLEAGVMFIEAVIEGYFVEKFWDDAKPDVERDAGRIVDFIFCGIQNNTLLRGDAS